MADFTKNLHLEKPLPEEFYDVSVQNGNMEKIDAAVAGKLSREDVAEEVKKAVEDGSLTAGDLGAVSEDMVGAPNGVAGLGENGAVPVARGGTGATTEQGVIDAFGIFLAISAAAAYDPERSYTVGDYCTHGGKLHKCNTPIESGEVWNAAHWTETTVAKELAGKADKTSPQEHEISFRSGWSSAAAKSTYYKTQEGSCVVNCAVYGTGAASDNFIATLPAGFRPNATVCRAAHAYKGGIRGIAEAQIAANGDIVIYSPIEFDYVSFGATFLAQN